MTLVIEKIKMNKSKGFTIIELLVVVAIIAVLTGIVLVNVTSYINKGRDASIKGNLSTILTNGAVFYDTNSTYAGFCASTNVTVPQLAIAGAGGASTCTQNGTNTAWCACSTLKVTAGNVFCVDSTGVKKESANTCALACPAAGACI